MIVVDGLVGRAIVVNQADQPIDRILADGNAVVVGRVAKIARHGLANERRDTGAAAASLIAELFVGAPVQPEVGRGVLGHRRTTVSRYRYGVNAGGGHRTVLTSNDANARSGRRSREADLRRPAIPQS